MSIRSALAGTVAAVAIATTIGAPAANALTPREIAFVNAMRAHDPGWVRVVGTRTVLNRGYEICRGARSAPYITAAAHRHLCPKRR